MWPTLRDGDIVRFEIIDTKLIEPNLVVLLKHPFKKDFNLIKRISTIENGEVFLVGDNPDPNASEDSHNFGRINVKDIIAVIVNNNS